MKSIASILVYFLLISSSLSKPVENELTSNANDDEANKVKHFFDVLHDKMNNRMKRIIDGLIKDLRSQEVPAVELVRYPLNYPMGPIHQNVTYAIELVYKHTQYWDILKSDFFSLFKDELKEVPPLSQIENIYKIFTNVCLKFEDGTAKDNLMKENEKSKVFRFSIVDKIIPNAKKFFETSEKYNKEYP